MAKDLQALVKDRLSTAAVEIFALFEEAVAVYKNEICRLEMETERQRGLLDTAYGLQRTLANAQIELRSQDQICASVKREEYADDVKEEQQQVSIQQEMTLTIVEAVGNVQEPLLQRLTADNKEEEEHRGADTGAGLEPALSDTGEQTENCDSEEEWTAAASSSSNVEIAAQSYQRRCAEKGSTGNLHEVPNSPVTDAGSRVDFEMCECGRVFLDKSDFEKHKETHFKYRPFSCKICDKKFTQKGHVDSHMKTHTGEKRFSCSVCDKRFAHKANLHGHMKKTHDRPFWRPGFKDRVSERPFKCPLCEKTFRLKSYLERHLTIHTAHRPFTCSICSKSFRWKQELKNHEVIHTRETTFSCKQCGSAFDQRQALRQHIKASHVEDKPFRCAGCNRKFKDEATLQSHMTNVHINALDKPFRCKVCDSRFTYESNLKAHMKKHDNMRLENMPPL